MHGLSEVRALEDMCIDATEDYSCTAVKYTWLKEWSPRRREGSPVLGPGQTPHFLSITL